jgi:hypothetical protein
MNEKYEGRWLCPYCGAENLGRFEECNGYGSNGCGAGRPKSVRFYLPEDSPVVTDPDQIADAESGADWHCSHCDSGNKGAVNGLKVLSCVHCGNARDGSDHTHETKTYAAGAVPRSDAETRAPRPNRRPDSRPRASSSDASDTPSRGSLAAVVGVFTFLAMAAFAAWYFLASNVEARLTITDKSWERVVLIEQMTVKQDEGWTVPIGARALDSEKRHYDTIDEVIGHETKHRDGQEWTGEYRTYDCGKRKDLGNGYFENDPCKEKIMRDVKIPYEVPITRPKKIYKPWYTFEYDDWNVVKRHATSGGDTQPHWHDELTKFQMRNFRARQGSQSYQIQVMTPEGAITRTLPLSTWARQSVDSTVIGHYNRLGQLNSITWN